MDGENGEESFAPPQKAQKLQRNDAKVLEQSRKLSRRGKEESVEEWKIEEEESLGGFKRERWCFGF